MTLSEEYKGFILQAKLSSNLVAPVSVMPIECIVAETCPGLGGAQTRRVQGLGTVVLTRSLWQGSDALAAQVILPVHASAKAIKCKPTPAFPRSTISTGPSLNPHFEDIQLAS